jgi:Mrp family chromosome partitioning ATPase
MDNLDESFRILRVTLETRFTEPAVIVVTSALKSDGAAFVASGLARAFAESGAPTLFVGAADGNGAHHVAGARPALQCPNLDVVPLASAASLTELRSRYRAIVVDAKPVPADANACEFARRADGVLLAVKLGRRPEAADREVMRLLNSFGCDVVGVVPTRGTLPEPFRTAAERELVDRHDYETKLRLTTRQVEVAR